jgi:predicted nucleic acid-binding protein
MSVLVDTNVLLRRAQPTHRDCGVAIQSVADLLARGIALHFTPQNLIEFWSVATRPAASNGLGLPVPLVLDEIATIQELLVELPECAAVFRNWQQLVTQHQVKGAKVHDARLAAVARTYGVKSILTFNTADFVRYDHLTVRHPAEAAQWIPPRS